MAPVQRLVVDLMKPYDPDLVEFAREAAGIEGVDGVNAAVLENDSEAQTVKLTAEGGDVSLDAITEVVSDLGGAVQTSLTDMLAVSLVVLAVFYWREGIDRPAAVACLLLYFPSVLHA
jgi:hypothetical protein